MINLLPLEQKEELKREEKWKLTLILGIIFLIFLLCLFLILLSIRINVSSELEAQKNLSALEEGRFKTPEIQQFQEQITLLNENLLGINSFYQDQSSLTKVLEKISATIPSTIHLTRLSWQKENFQVELSGRASLREDLFELKNNLEKEKDFKDVYFPPSDWIKPKDVDFYVTFKATPQK